MSLFGLGGKIALVTGGTKGMGLAIVQRMVEHGARVAFCSRAQDACDALAQRLNAQAGRDGEVALGIGCDISDTAALQSMVDRVLEKWGRIDILVSNAAVVGDHGPGKKSSESEAAFDAMLGTNIYSNFRLCGMVAPQMIARRDGSIIFITSAAAALTLPHILPYSVAKAGLTHMARILAADYAPHNVRVNCISPGMIRTDTPNSRRVWDDPQLYAAATATLPLRRGGEPDEIAAGVLFLASPGGAFVTGVTLPIDGGVTGTHTRD